MCTDTKGRIAEAVEQMLQTRPVCKITVQSVMEQTQMKRQSFYYHYQDIYSVLEWIVETELCAPLQFDGAQAPGEWCLRALTPLREKQAIASYSGERDRVFPARLLTIKSSFFMVGCAP